jgi:hypothetical protein
MEVHTVTLPTFMAITEALANGIESNALQVSVSGAKYVDVFRFTRNGEGLGSKSYPISALITSVDTFEAHRERYAYEEILLLAMLCSTRKLTAIMHLPGVAMIVRNALDSAADVVAKYIAAGQEPVICSELVYRIFKNAGEAYQLAILGADATKLAAISNVPDERNLTPEMRDLQSAASAFLANYDEAKKAGRAKATLSTAAPEQSLAATIADFVTPHDLFVSLQLIGTLSLANTSVRQATVGKT